MDAVGKSRPMARDFEAPCALRSKSFLVAMPFRRKHCNSILSVNSGFAHFCTILHKTLIGRSRSEEAPILDVETGQKSVYPGFLTRCDQPNLLVLGPMRLFTLVSSSLYCFCLGNLLELVAGPFALPFATLHLWVLRTCKAWQVLCVSAKLICWHLSFSRLPGQ